MDKLKIWKGDVPFEERERIWQEEKAKAESQKPLKTLSQLPKMVGITEDTKRFLRFKSLWWLLRKDHKWAILKKLAKRPFYYARRLIRSYFGAYPMTESGDFFFYGIDSLDTFKALLKEDTVFLVGFSYCHKPLECPSGRFSEKCIHDPENLVCRQCFISRAINQLPSHNTEFILIKTVHDIGRRVFEVMERYPGKPIVFLITACEMTLKMFGDFGNMAGVRGVGVKLAGRICNTMKAFKLSEEGIKPGLTVVLDETQREMMELIRVRQEN